MLKVLLILSLLGISSHAVHPPFFQASPQQPYHLSVGAVLFNQNGEIACHYFDHLFGHKDIYILMRESMENDEHPLHTMQRGLQEEFGAIAEPVAFLGCLSGDLPYTGFPFNKTTLYIACRLITWDPNERDPNDPEATSQICWLQPEELIERMQSQRARFGNRVDADESEIIYRALPYIRSS